MTVQVNVYEAKTNLSKLLERVQQGERVIISKNGKPVADLIFHEPNKIVFDGLKGEIEFDDRDFDEPDPEILAMFYGDDAAPR
jgi:antitoxin (DNA-binding transcriptional repressor) of toxin-antitoxin stability system